jgi:hypothetical protein
MTFIEQGTTGAYRQTWRKGNPRSLLETIITKNPRADERRLHELFWREIEDDKELLRACIEYWLDNNYHSLKREMSGLPKSTSKPAQVTVDAVSKTKAQIKKQIVHEARIMLLDLVMPNNKLLRNCTGRDCIKIGGWLGQLGKKVPATKTVAETLSEKEVYDIWDQATK